MSTNSVYLAGPITGDTYEDARYGWRSEFETMIHRYNIMHSPLERIQCVSPMRGKEHLLDDDNTPMSCDADKYDVAISTNSAIVTRDYNDVTRTSCMLANFLGSNRVSIGTCVEFGFAHAARKPIIMVMEEEGNLHEHGFLTEIAGYRVDTLEEAAFIVQHLCGGGL